MASVERERQDGLRRRRRMACQAGRRVEARSDGDHICSASVWAASDGDIDAAYRATGAVGHWCWRRCGRTRGAGASARHRKLPRRRTARRGFARRPARSSCIRDAVERLSAAPEYDEPLVSPRWALSGRAPADPHQRQASPSVKANTARARSLRRMARNEVNCTGGRSRDRRRVRIETPAGAGAPA